MRYNPAFSGLDAWGFEIALLTPGKKDEGLLTLSRKAIEEVLLPMLMGAIVVTTESPMFFLLLFILATLQKGGEIVFERLTIDSLRARYFTQIVDGTAVRFIDFIVDLQMKVSLDLSIPILRTSIKTDRPIGIDLKGLTLRWSVSKKSFEPIWEPEGSIEFDLSDQAIMKDSALEVIKFGAGKWEKGLWFDVGVQLNG